MLPLFPVSRVNSVIFYFCLQIFNALDNKMVDYPTVEVTSKDPAQDCKVVVVGDSRCGKTSLIQRFITDEFNEVSISYESQKV